MTLFDSSRDKILPIFSPKGYPFLSRTHSSQSLLPLLLLLLFAFVIIFFASKSHWWFRWSHALGFLPAAEDRRGRDIMDLSIDLIINGRRQKRGNRQKDREKENISSVVECLWQCKRKTRRQMMDINRINVDYFDLNTENAKYDDRNLIFGRREGKRSDKDDFVIVRRSFHRLLILKQQQMFEQRRTVGVCWEGKGERRKRKRGRKHQWQGGVSLSRGHVNCMEREFNQDTLSSFFTWKKTGAKTLKIVHVRRQSLTDSRSKK